MSDKERLREPIKVATAMIVNSLVHGEYASVARMTGGRFIPGTDLERIVAQHGQNLIAPPDSAYENLQLVQESAAPPTFRVAVPLWSHEYVLSDLMLELRMIETCPGVVDVEVISLGPVPVDARLTDAELETVVSVVEALVDKNDEYFREVGAYNHGNPYESTQAHGHWDQVDLVIPPGDPQTWLSYATRGLGGKSVSVGVVMWTVQEGRSDLTLELEIELTANGTQKVRFVDLHVM